MSDARANVIGLSDYVYQRTRSRLAGLTDDEYLWEPVLGCWTIRRTGSGAHRADYADRPVAVLRPVTGAGDPPFTTIAWRLWHLIGWYGGKRNPQWLGVERPPGGFERDDPAPATAVEAIAVLDLRVPRAERRGEVNDQRMIAATSPRSGGMLTVLGMDPQTHGSAIRARLGVVPRTTPWTVS